MDQDVKNEVMGVYRQIAEAESQVHGAVVELVHFHEVGAMDAVADITAFCYMLKKINPDRIICSPINVGSGQVKCAHGILPVPAPATAVILKGVPIYSTEIKGELCTPTGAAILKHFVNEFGEMPVMSTNAIGYGMGKKDFERANCVRMILGEDQSAKKKSSIKSKVLASSLGKEEVGDSVAELIFTIDDMTGEEIGYAAENLFACGALDVYGVPVYMKKNRPGTEAHVLCNPADKKSVVEGIFKYTSTLGIRERICERYVLDRKTEVIDTPYGEVRVKKAEGFGVKKFKYEYEDLAWIAREKKISLAEAEKLVIDVGANSKTDKKKK